MGHLIGYIDYKKDTNSKEIYEDIFEYASREGDSGYSNHIKFHNNIICDNREDAEKKIQELDNGWYDDHAVLYKKYKDCKDTKKIKDLKTKIETLNKTYKEYAKKSSISNFKSDFIGCKKCGSKINKDYIYNDRCPCCKQDMRSESTKEKLESYKSKIEKANNDLKKEIQKEKEKTGKYELMWLVKYEFHC